MPIVRRLSALLATLPLLLLSLQGNAMLCMPGGTGATTVAPAAASRSNAAGMHHAMSIANDRESTDTEPHRGAPCRDPHSLGACVSMPSCAGVTALPPSDSGGATSSDHDIVALVPLAAPTAPGVAPELPPPRA